MGDFVSKKDRIVESFLDGLIDKNKRDLRPSKFSDEIRVHTERESVLEARKIALERMLDNHKKSGPCISPHHISLNISFNRKGGISICFALL